MGSMLINITITEVERHLLHALSTGASNKHMARFLGKSEFTVRNQLSNLFKRINVSNRTQATSWYRDHMMNKEAGRLDSTYVPLQERQDALKIAM